MLRLTRAAWSVLFRTALALAVLGFGLWWYFRAIDRVAGYEIPLSALLYSRDPFLVVGFGGVLGAFLLWRLRPQRRLAPSATMPCGGAMTELAFAPGRDYAYCTKRCVHSRADFEARRAYLD